MFVAVKLSAPNTNYGNPRRLYVVSKVSADSQYSERVAVIDEEYLGIQALKKEYPDAVLLQEINVSPAEYKRWLKVGENDRKLRAE